MLGSIARPASIMGPGVTSSLPLLDPIDAFPPVTDPAAAMRALVEFFENRQMLMREDFRRILRKIQGADAKT
jgi:hypothetical protein